MSCEFDRETLGLRDEKGFLYGVWCTYLTKINPFNHLVVDRGLVWVGALRSS